MIDGFREACRVVGQQHTDHTAEDLMHCWLMLGISTASRSVHDSFAAAIKGLPDSISTIAAFAGVTESAVSQWRRGARLPSYRILRHLAREWPELSVFLGLDGDWPIPRLRERRVSHRERRAAKIKPPIKSGAKPPTPNSSFDLVKAAAREAVRLATEGG